METITDLIKDVPVPKMVKIREVFDSTHIPADQIAETVRKELSREALSSQIKPGMRIAIVDDLLATGGTALATAKLVEQAGGEVAAIRFAMELTDLDGRSVLEGYDVGAVIQY